MADNAELGQLSGTPVPTASAAGALHAAEAAEGALQDLRRLSDVPIDLTVEIGRARLTVGETLELRQGSIVTLNRMAGEPVDVLVNGTQIARGEVVVIDEQFGIRITDVVGGNPAGPVPAAAPEEAAATGEEAEPQP